MKLLMNRRTVPYPNENVTVYQANPEEISWIRNAGANTLAPGDNTIHAIGVNLMTRYLIPFEIVSVLLMMALVGAAHLARRTKKQ